LPWRKTSVAEGVGYDAKRTTARGQVFNGQTPSAEDDLPWRSPAVVTTETAYEKSRVEMRRATGSILEEYGISTSDVKTGVVEASHP
jgi:hypothetical protein